jgi:predicted PhzF superfamily epimerase YddE/YHI9
LECLGREDYLAVFTSEQDIVDIEPDHSLLAKLDLRGIIVTAPGSEVDFVARFFAPTLNVPEDPVTGSAYTHLTPFWSARLGTRSLLPGRFQREAGN